MVKIIIQALGGLGIFIFGMKLMSEGLQQVAGDRLRKFLEKVSANRAVGCLTGALVTAAVQSSSATTVTVVGFVNAGLMNLTQAVGVVLGANVGTTITAQLIAFKITDLALPAIAIGVAIKLFSKRRKHRFIGQVILGFGLLFYGMTIMKTGFKPLRTDPEFIAFFTKFDAESLGGILLCVLTGTILTMLVQSSSATVGITMALASEGLLNLPGSIALILGDNIGTTITAELSAIGSSVTSHQTARAHTMFNVLGVLYIVLLFSPFVHMVEWVTSSFMGAGPPEAIINGGKPNISRYIANAHTMFNVINAVVFLLALPLLVKAAERLTVGKHEQGHVELARPRYLEYKHIDNPPVALASAREEILRLGNAALKMYDEVTEVMNTRRLDDLYSARAAEDSLDLLQREIIEYLVQTSQGSISGKESREIASLMRMANNFERVGDAVDNLAILAEEMIENKLYLSMEGVTDYQTIRDKVATFIEVVIIAVRERDEEVMTVALELENSIDFMREEMRDNYLSRLRNGVCAVDPSLIFVDMLSNFEKIGDYCYNISQAVAGQR